MVKQTGGSVNKRIIIISSALLMAFSLVTNAQISFAAPPITIGSCQQLIDTFPNDTTNISATVELNNDIDCNGYVIAPFFYNNLSGGFAGIFNGNSHTISNFTADGSITKSMGFMSQALDAVFKDLTLKNITIPASAATDQRNTGALLGYAEATTIDNVHIVNGSVTGKKALGGLVGDFENWNSPSFGDSSITNSSFSGNVHSLSGSFATREVGGLVGSVYLGYNSNIISGNDASNATVTVDATDTSNIGGLIGAVGVWRDDIAETHLTVSNNYASGVDTLRAITDPSTVSFDQVGGLIGGMNISTDGMFESYGNHVEGTVTGTSYVGGMFGDVVADAYSYHNLYFHDEHTNIDVLGDHNVGGMFGNINPYNYSGPAKSFHVANVSAGGTITGNSTVGGLAGSLYTDDSTLANQLFIEKANATGDVYGRVYGGIQTSVLGGLIGEKYSSSNNANTTISQVYATGNIYAESSLIGLSDNIGGLIGISDQLYLSDAYSRGNIYDTGTGTIGASSGGIGYFQVKPFGVEYPSDVSNIYSTGSSAGSANVGGLFGYNDSTSQPTNSYWDTQTSGQPTSSGGVGQTTAAMKSQVTFSGWNFTNTWKIDPLINNGYPCLLFSQQCNSDVDGDGIPNSVENAGPNNGDGNNDGIRDSDQSNVTTTYNATTGTYVTVVVNGTSSLSSVTTSNESNNVVQDPALNYPGGFVGQTTTVSSPGANTDTTVYFNNVAVTDPVVVTYDTVSNTYTPQASPAFTFTQNSPQTTIVDYVATDGGINDTDGLVNGVISSPLIGLGIVASVEASTGITAPNTGLQNNQMWTYLITLLAGIYTILLISKPRIIIRKK